MTVGSAAASEHYVLKCWYGRYSRRWLVLIKPPSGDAIACSGETELEALSRAEELVAELRLERSAA